MSTHNTKVPNPNFNKHKNSAQASNGKGKEELRNKSSSNTQETHDNPRHAKLITKTAQNPNDKGKGVEERE